MTENKTTAVSATGFKFEVAPDSSGSAGTYVELGEIRDDDLELPEDSTEIIRFRTNQSPGKYTESVPGGKTLGEGTVSMNFVPGNAGQVLMEGYFTNRTKVWFKFTNAAATFVTIFQAYVSKRPHMFKGGDVDRVTYTFTPTGGPQTGSTFS